MSAVGATLGLVEVRESDVAGIPAGNIRVPQDEFVAVWMTASRRAEEQGAQGATDWYAVAVAVTCRWLATAPMRPKTGAHRLTRSPATNRARVAYEELIEAEYLAAEMLEQRRPDIVEHEPGWCEGVRATLRWAWRRSGPRPVEVPGPAGRVDASSAAHG
jgi:hypothetical protein